VKALTYLLTPSAVAALLIAAGFLALLWNRARPAGRWLIGAGAMMTLVFSSGLTATHLMSPLEYQYPRLENAAAWPKVRHIVVLTGWATEDTAMPLSGRLNVSSAYRLMMAMEVYRERPDCQVIVSGDAPTARIMGEVLTRLGLPADRLRLEDASHSTVESFEHLSPMLAGTPFFLVTSAGHMPRSMQMAHAHGLEAVPVPTDHQMPRDWRKASWLPLASSFAVSDLAIHEYLGRAWFALQK
jgi:uncharacterized SAM-binding protein YcdF (DUF218 family)